MTVTLKQAQELWADYLEAATPIADNDNSGIDLYDIEGMEEAAHALFEALISTLSTVKQEAGE